MDVIGENTGYKPYYFLQDMGREGGLSLVWLNSSLIGQELDNDE